MKNKQSFLNEVRTHLDAGERRPKHFKRTRTISKALSIPGVLIITSMLVLGALIGFIWTTYTLQIEGDIDVNGGVQEEITLYYDDVQLTGTEMTITTMDYTELYPGDDYTVIHEFESTDGHAFDIDIDTSSLPVNTDPESLWYGFDIWFLEHGTQTNLTEFTVMPTSTYTFDIRYRVHPLFEEPIVTYPFLVVYNIEIANLPPVTTNDTLYVEYGSTEIVNITENDIDYDNDPITIVGFATGPSGVTITDLDGHRLSVNNNYGAGGTNIFEIWVDVTDGHTIVREYLVLTLHC